jgi:hypothetical protein
VALVLFLHRKFTSDTIPNVGNWRSMTLVWPPMAYNHHSKFYENESTASKCKRDTKESMIISQVSFLKKKKGKLAKNTVL